MKPDNKHVQSNMNLCFENEVNYELFNDEENVKFFNEYIETTFSISKLGIFIKTIDKDKDGTIIYNGTIPSSTELTDKDGKELSYYYIVNKAKDLLIKYRKDLGLKNAENITIHYTIRDQRWTKALFESYVHYMMDTVILPYYEGEYKEEDVWAY